MTIMSSSSGPINSLGYRLVTILLFSLGPDSIIGYMLVTMTLSSVGPVNGLGYWSVTMMLSSVGPVNSLARLQVGDHLFVLCILYFLLSKVNTIIHFLYPHFLKKVRVYLLLPLSVRPSERKVCHWYSVYILGI